MTTVERLPQSPDTQAWEESAPWLLSTAARLLEESIDQAKAKSGLSLVETRTFAEGLLGEPGDESLYQTATLHFELVATQAEAEQAEQLVTQIVSSYGEYFALHGFSIRGKVVSIDELGQALRAS